MSSLEAANASVTDWTHGEQDLGPLAWVLDELRKSLDGTVKAMRRFVRDAEIARESDLASLDVGPLRIARQQLHQASGALEMVGMVSPALILRALESAVQKYVQRPELCTDEVANTIERASFALVAYLESVLAGKQVSPVALFPQYRDAQKLNGVERVHPADLWPVERRFREPELTITVAPLPYDAAARAKLDNAVLRIVKSSDSQAETELLELCLGFAAGESDKQIRAFWKICAGFFEALANGLISSDIYAKRVASRVLLQYAALAKGERTVADRLVHELLFFCAQAKSASDASGKPTPALAAVREAFGLVRHVPVDYDVARFGLYDPAVLIQARKRIGAATETWSALAGGDRNKLKPSVDQFSLVCDSLRKLHPGSEPLAAALMNAVEATSRSGEPPSAALAMEVATAVLYLQASFEELDVAQELMGARASRLAQRLDSVAAGGESQPLEPWMEELYRRVSDHQTMGSVVDELRATLADAEKSMDQFFRTPDDATVLNSVPGRLGQMRGVLSVLGLDQASHAVVHMRDMVERLVVGTVSAEERPAVFDKLGNSLGALGFLIDMLSYQRTMARKLFVFDETQGELKLVMGRAKQDRVDDEPPVAAKPASGDVLGTVAVAPQPVAQPAAPETAEIERTVLMPLVDDDVIEHVDFVHTQPMDPELLEPAMFVEPSTSRELKDLGFSLELDKAPLVKDEAAAAAPAVAIAVEPIQPPVSAPLPAPGDEDEELLDIFLEEAREVIATGLGAIENLHQSPSDLSEQTTLRRAFHTLKGSSRMVGLNAFGDAAWSMEQVLNAWLAEQKPVADNLLKLSRDSLTEFGRWVEDIAAGKAEHWDPQVFSISAEAMRTEGRFVPLALAAAGVAQSATTQAYVPAAPIEVAVESVAEPVVEPIEPVVQELAPVALDAGMFDLPELNLEVSEPEPLTPVAAVTPATGALEFEPFDFTLDTAAPVPAAEPSLETLAFEQPAEAAEPALAMEFVEPTVESFEAPAVDVGGVEEIDFSAFEQALENFTPEAEQAPAGVPELTAEPALDVLSDAVAESVIDPVIDPVFEPVIELSAPAPLETVEAIETVDAAQEVSLPGLHDEVSVPDQVPAEGAFAEFTELLPLMDAVPEPVVEPVAELVTAAEVSAPVDESEDDSVKVIGSLRISMPLYNVYLGEADEWSDRLTNSLLEWQREPNVPVPEVAIARAHSLAGSSATVGFTALSELARTLEHALQHIQPQQFGVPEQVSVFIAAAEDIRRLLHQFAAGFIKEPSAHLQPQLHEIMDCELISGLAPLNGEDADDVLNVPAALHEDSATTVALQEVLDEPAPTPVAAPVRGYVAPALSVPVIQTVALVPQATHSSARYGDDDIDVLDVIDPDLFPIFEEEAIELLPTLGGALRQWAAHPGNLTARSELLRALHTLKGSARLAGAMRLGEMAHRMETAVEEVDKDNASTADIEPLLTSFDGLQESFETLRSVGAQPLSEPVIAAIAPLDVVEPSVSLAPQAVPSSGEPAAPVNELATAKAHAIAPQVVIARPVALQPVSARSAASQTVRVRSQLLDRLVNQAGEVMIARSRLDSRMGQMRGSLNDLSGNLERLRQHLRDIEVQAETQMQSRMALSKDSAAGFDPLEFDRFTRVQELTRMMAESVNDVATVQRNLQRAMEGAEDDLISQGRQARELQRDLLRTRMVEFESISERLYALVRQSSKETGKQIKLDIAGGNIEMDRGVLDRMTPAFEHLMRNCVGHGIESPADRVAQGKPATGTITIALRQEGNDVSVEFRDDGAGLNVERIRAKAIERGLITDDMPVGDAEAANLIFMPGFSTAAEVTGLSGRGIGMDVVRTEVNALGGRIETTTSVGRGSSFRLILPLTTAVTQVVMLRAGNLSIGVPASVVEVVRRASANELTSAYSSHQFEEGSDTLNFFWAGALLQSSTRSTETQNKIRPIVILRSASQRIAMHVDEVLGNQEVVVKNLGPQLSRLPGMAGMSVLASGAVVLIYNPVALANVYGAKILEAEASAAQQAERNAALAAEQEAAGLPVTPMEPVVPVVPSPPQVPLVLVVDDSITVRRVTQRLLQREGYRVSLAADGLQALSRLQEERPTVVLSDIEMPRMDGFDLARNIRNDQSLKDLPIIMITSRIAQKHREHAMELGVNHYLGKPYSDEELLSLVQHYAHLEAEASRS